MRLIDADALLTDRRKRMYYHLPNGDTAIPVIDVEHAPTIEERKTGEWIEAEVMPKTFDVNGIETWASKMQCDQCGFITYAIEGHMGQYNFCPNCGADMRGGNHENP